MQKNAHFPNRILPYFLLGPQLIITIVFFIWPASTAIKQSFLRGDAFGLHSHFAALGNFKDVLQSSDYLNALWVSAVFSTVLTLLTMASGLYTHSCS